MHRFFLYILLIISIISTLSSCGDDNEPIVPQKERTVLVYMIAENRLSKYSDDDTQELLTATTQNTIPDNCNILVYQDNASTPRIIQYSRGEKRVLKTFADEQNSADSTIMLRTLNEMIQLSPARHYSLVLWSHGSGWEPMPEKKKQKRAFGIDNGKNSSSEDGDYAMNISSIHWVLQQLPHLDYLLWDACFMQTIETAYELRNCATWIIGAPSETPAYGAPYTNVAKALCEADITTLFAQYAHYYNGTSSKQLALPLSAILTSQLPALASATAPYVQKYLRADKVGTMTSQLLNKINNIQKYSPLFCYEWEDKYYYTGMPTAFDMMSLMAHFLSPEEYDLWLNAYKKAVPHINTSKEWASMFSTQQKTEEGTTITFTSDCYTQTDHDHFGSVSMHIPLAHYNDYGYNRFFSTYEWHKAAGF